MIEPDATCVRSESHANLQQTARDVVTFNWEGLGKLWIIRVQILRTDIKKGKLDSALFTP
jgi:hypothetical protein